MKVLSGLVNFLLCLALMAVGLFVVVDRTASATYLHRLVESTRLYSESAAVLPDLIVAEMRDGNQALVDTQRVAVQAALKSIMTPEVLQAAVDPLIDQLDALFRGTGQSATLRLADSYPGLRVLGIAVPLDQLPTVTLSASDSSVAPAIRNFHRFIQMTQLLLYATLGLLVLAILLATIRGAYVGVGVAFVVSGVFNGLIAAGIWLGLPMLLSRIQLEQSVALLQPLIAKLVTQLASDVRNGIGLYALGLLVLGILLINLRRYLPRYQPPTSPLDSLSNDDAPKMLDEVAPPATKPAKPIRPTIRS